MKNEKIDNILKKKVVVLDGATGTELQKHGMPIGVKPEVWCLNNPKALLAVHSGYVKAGADIIYTSTFGANSPKLGQYGEHNINKINKELALIARKAAKKRVLVAGDIGPTGEFVEPFGSLKFEQAVNIFKEQVKGLLSGGVDLFVIETMMDIQEARAALIAVKEITDKFTIVTMTFASGGRTLNGTDPLAALVTLQSLGANAVGCNCSSGPQQMLKLIKIMKPYAKVPLVAKPNAGMPRLVGEKTFFDMSPKEFSFFAKKLVAAGASLLGGCCGTTPEYIKNLSQKVLGMKSRPLSQKSFSAVSSARKGVIFKRKNSFSIIGESINPTGKKMFQKELREGKTSLVRHLAREQEKSGASFLDVNVGASGIDEVKTLKNIISLLAVDSNLPLVIDSTKIEAIESALRIYPGRALINSITGEKNKLKKLLFLAAKYGAMFILLPLKGKKIPENQKERREIIKYIFKEAKGYGFSKDDIIIDAMILSVSSRPKAALETLKTITWVSNVFKCNTVIGLSNVSFGMPKRSLINETFLTMAKKQGLNLAIANPSRVKTKFSKLAEKFLINKDKDAYNFLAYFNKSLRENKKSGVQITPEQKIYQAIIEGNREDIKGLIKEAIALKLPAGKLIAQAMIPAINKTGDLFDKKEYFLPQLVASAETMSLAFSQLKPFLKTDRLNNDKKVVVLLATVKGDIHDIGKNIVALMLKNHGFKIVDLGKDVSAERIIREIKKYKHPIVGLSALMTTTMIKMKEVVDKSKEERLNCRFILGGAVVSKAYAHSLGVKYASDSVEAVRVVKYLNKIKKKGEK